MESQCLLSPKHPKTTQEESKGKTWGWEGTRFDLRHGHMNAVFTLAVDRQLLLWVVRAIQRNYGLSQGCCEQAVVYPQYAELETPALKSASE